MPPVALIADSTADLPPAYRDEHGIATVPLRVIFGDEVLVDGVEITADEFYDRMRRGTVTPRTSQPTPAEFEAAFRAAGAGGRQVVCTTMSSEMSGTHGAAVMAAQACSDVDVRVIDTRTVAIGHTAIVTALVEARDAGADADALVAAAQEVIAGQRSIFTLETLEYLRRGGRIGAAAKIFGSARSVKPLLEIVDGRVQPRERVRTASRALARLADLAVEAAGDQPVDVCVSHLANAARAEELAAALTERLSSGLEGREVMCGELGAVLGAHVGPGMVAVCVSPRP